LPAPSVLGTHKRQFRHSAKTSRLSSVANPPTGNLLQPLQIDEPNRFAIGKIDEFLRPELGKGTANRLKRGSDMICDVSPGKLNSERIRTLGIRGKMRSNAQQQPSYACHTILLAHRQHERQCIRQDLMGTAGLISAAHAGDLRPLYPAIRYRLGGKLLTGRLSRHYNIAGPIECQDLTITILKKPDSAYDTFHDFDLVGLLFAFPEKGASTWNKKCREIALFVTVVSCQSKRGSLRLAIVEKRQFIKHFNIPLP